MQSLVSPSAARARLHPVIRALTPKLRFGVNDSVSGGACLSRTTASAHNAEFLPPRSPRGVAPSAERKVGAQLTPWHHLNHLLIATSHSPVLRLYPHPCSASYTLILQHVATFHGAFFCPTSAPTSLDTISKNPPRLTTHLPFLPKTGHWETCHLPTCLCILASTRKSTSHPFSLSRHGFLC